jgi:hypothetical protein
MPFQPGQSGNPAGKRPGATSPEAAVRKVIAPHLPELAEVLVLRGLDGDAESARMAIMLFTQLKQPRRKPA